jgi:hypothetical protein
MLSKEFRWDKKLKSIVSKVPDSVLTKAKSFSVYEPKEMPNALRPYGKFLSRVI